MEIGFPIPQLPEADGSEWQVEEDEGGSWKKPHVGHGQHRQLVEQRGNTDLEMDESHGSDDESLTSGNTDEGELELTQFEDRSSCSTGRGGRSKSMEEREPTFDIEPTDSRCLDQQEAAMVVRGEVLDNSLPRSPEEKFKMDSHQRDKSIDERKPIYRSQPQEQVEDVLISEGEWSSGLSGVTGPFLAARKSKSPIQGTFSPADLVHEGRAQKDDLEDNQAAYDQTHSSPTRGYYEHAEQTWEGEDLTILEDPTQKEKSSTDLEKREFVPNDLIRREQVSGISDVRNLIVADPSQQDLMTGNILDEKHSRTEDPDNHNDGRVGRISQNGENEDEREGDDLQINQDCQNSKLSGPPLVEDTEDQKENETEEMNEIKMQRPEDQERLLDESEQMLAIDGEKKQGGQIGQPSSKSKNMTIAMMMT